MRLLEDLTEVLRDQPKLPSRFYDIPLASIAAFYDKHQLPYERYLLACARALTWYTKTLIPFIGKPGVATTTIDQVYDDLAYYSPKSDPWKDCFKEFPDHPYLFGDLSTKVIPIPLRIDPEARFMHITYWSSSRESSERDGRELGVIELSPSLTEITQSNFRMRPDALILGTRDLSHQIPSLAAPVLLTPYLAGPKRAARATSASDSPPSVVLL